MDRKIRVAVIGVKGLPGFGGSARANEKLLTRLAKEFDITVYALDSHAVADNYEGVNQLIFKSKKNKKVNTIFLYIKSLFHILFIEKFGLIHLNHGVSGFLIPFIRIKYKTITTIRGLNYKGDDKWNSIEYFFLKFFEIVAFKLSNVTATVQKSSVFKIKKYTNKPVLYIPNGVENNYLKYKEYVSEDVITFSAARIIHLKGLHDLLSALHILNYKGIINVIGDLNQVDDYKNKIEELSQGLNINFLGLLRSEEDLFKELRKSRVFVFPSYSEGMSNMLLEVASLKVPIIASDISPNRDVFGEDEVRYFKVGDVNELALGIREILSNDTLAEKYANSAYEKVTDDFGWDTIAKAYSNLYKDQATL